MAVKGRFHKLDDNKKRRITGKANAYSRAWSHFRQERTARVSERVDIKGILNDVNSEED
jgi:hypothetical protein